MLASGSYDPSIRIWDVRSGEQKLNLGDHPGHVKSLAFSGDGRLLVSTGADGARVWNLPSGSLRTMIPTTRGVVAAVFSPDGDRVATAGGNGVTIWDVATGSGFGTAPLPGVS
jgi:WD40 repeat protein